ncbi:MAG TPA: hypothetical protein VNP96_01620 [Solirubrobacterales bacterium]|nr:hypothetical protein [Solirubrobacterales bacterium]
MSAIRDIAQTWTCDRCGVAVSRMHGEQTPLPASWVRSADGQFCLNCRRERAAEAALDAAPSDSDRDTRAKLRRAGLIEFEVQRAPDHADSVIAKACHSSPSVVAAARQRLDSLVGGR